MRFFRRKKDPISARAQVLQSEIAALETQIRKLDAQLHQNGSHPQPRSQSVPAPAPARPRPPLFEQVERSRLQTPADSDTTSFHYNELGVRKYDPFAAWKRLKHHFRGPTSNNPKLVSYLAAGSLKGLRPLRYEKRVARNRFIALFLFLMLLLCGIVAVLRSP